MRTIACQTTTRLRPLSPGNNWGGTGSNHVSASWEGCARFGSHYDLPQGTFPVLVAIVGLNERLVSCHVPTPMRSGRELGPIQREGHFQSCGVGQIWLVRQQVHFFPPVVEFSGP